jgi:hypothetical protein
VSGLLGPGGYFAENLRMMSGFRVDDSWTRIRGERQENIISHKDKRRLSHRMYSLISFRKSTPPHNHQLIVYYH